MCLSHSWKGFTLSTLQKLSFNNQIKSQSIWFRRSNKFICSKFIFSLSVYMTHRCWCCRCEQWCQSEVGSSLSLWTLCRHLENSQPGWLSGSCGCGIGSMLAWVSLEALGCPENGSGNLYMWTLSCGHHNDDSFPSPVAGEKNGQHCQRKSSSAARSVWACSFWSQLSVPGTQSLTHLMKCNKMAPKESNV